MENTVLISFKVMSILATGPKFNSFVKAVGWFWMDVVIQFQIFHTKYMGLIPVFKQN